MRALSIMILVGPVLLAGCPKNEGTTTTTADAASSSTPAASVSQVTLAPLDTSSSVATATPLMTATAVPTGGVVMMHGDAAAKPVTTGSAATTASPSTQAQLKQCCAALHKQSQQQSPQAAQLAQGAALCDGLAASMATAPTVPQLDQVKALLAGVQLPPVCQGL
jgi:hypothetical protein